MVRPWFASVGLGCWMPLVVAQAAPPSWAETVEQVASGVVSVRLDRTRAFDTTWYATSQATAFVVDAERGLLLTNRHVVSPGPVVAQAVFADSEELELEAVYRDPVHDFGFFHYDPEKLRYLTPHELELAPGLARVGSEIRVLGNDAGEKLSILAGTLARLDRPAPHYGPNTYNDFNTFYYQAASGTSGGSSGSPVIDAHGRVLAVNAGGTQRSAASYFLPLERVVRALDYLQRDEIPPRGTLGVTFVHRAFDELARLGLDPATEARRRADDPTRTGLLVVEAVLPEGPADGALRTGDVLLAVGGKPLGDFLSLEEVLDEAVGLEQIVTVERAGQPVEVALTVADLHAMTPDRYVSFGGGVLHDLSYQQARNHHQPRRGVYVADAGYLLERGGVPYQAVIQEVGERPTPTLDAWLEAVEALPAGQPVRVRWTQLGAPDRERVGSVTLSDRWFAAEHCVRGPDRWDCEPVHLAAPAPPEVKVAPPLPEATERVVRKVLPSVVQVEAFVPHRLDGVRGSAYVGPGLVVDAAAGLVITDQNTVPSAVVDATMTVGGTVTVPVEVVAQHPLHGLVLVKYPVDQLAGAPLQAATFATDPLEVGERVHHVGYDLMGRVVHLASEIAEIPVWRLPMPYRPRFRETNQPLGVLADETPAGGGVIVDRKGRVRGLHGSVSYDEVQDVAEREGIYPASALASFVAAYRADPAAPKVTGLEAELVPVPHARARELGLDMGGFGHLEDADGHRVALQVSLVTAGSPADAVLEHGDLVLAVDGTPVVSPEAVDQALVAGRPVALTLGRRGEIFEASLTPRALLALGTRRAVQWAGAMVQEVPLAVRQQRGRGEAGVYVDLRLRGSPSLRHGLGRNVMITEVQGQATPDLDAFLAAVEGLPDGAPVRLRTLQLSGREELIAVTLDLHYWPTVELAWSADRGWFRRDGRSASGAAVSTR